MAAALKSFAKEITSLDGFVMFVRSHGFPSAGAVYNESDPPELIVSYDDADGDPTAAVDSYENPDFIVAASDKPLGADGVAEAAANGSAVHTVRLTRSAAVDGSPRGVGNMTLSVTGRPPAPAALPSVAMVAGEAQISVGPASAPGEWEISVNDASRTISGAAIKLRFV
jgi:hypothetical protein